MSGAEALADIKAARLEAGAEAAVIIRTSGANETTYPPTAGTESEYGCWVNFSSYSARDRDGTQITARDVKVMVWPDAETDPRNGDRLKVAGQTFHLVNVDQMRWDGVALMWEAQARAADG